MARKNSKTVTDVRKMLDEQHLPQRYAHYMGFGVTWDNLIAVDATKTQLYETVEEYRLGKYPTFSPRNIYWAPTPKEGAMATLLDTCPWNGLVAIHFFPIETGGFHLYIQALQPPMSTKRSDATGPNAVEHAQTLATTIQGKYGIALDEEKGEIDDGWSPPKCIFVGNEGECLGQVHRRLSARGLSVDQIGYTLWVIYPDSQSHSKRRYGRNRMFGITPWGMAGGRCRLEFELVPGRTSWAPCKATIVQLIEDLHGDGFLELSTGKSSDTGSDASLAIPKLLSADEKGTPQPEIYVPKRETELIRWKAIWRAIEDSVTRGKVKPDDLTKMLQGAHNTRHLAKISDDTIRKIIKAGRAGKL